jgi:hypothetical protein
MLDTKPLSLLVVQQLLRKMQLVMQETKLKMGENNTIVSRILGKTIIGAGESITSEQALAERQGEIITTTHEPLKIKRDASEESRSHQHVDDIMLARPKRYVLA